MCVDIYIYIELLVRRKYWQELLYATDQQPNAVLEISITFTFTVSQLIAPVRNKISRKTQLQLQTEAVLKLPYGGGGPFQKHHMVMQTGHTWWTTTVAPCPIRRPTDIQARSCRQLPATSGSLENSFLHMSLLFLHFSFFWLIAIPCRSCRLQCNSTAQFPKCSHVWSGWICGWSWSRAH